MYCVLWHILCIVVYYDTHCVLCIVTYCVLCTYHEVQGMLLNKLSPQNQKIEKLKRFLMVSYDVLWCLVMSDLFS